MTKFITEREEKITRVSMVRKNYMSQMELLNTSWSMSMIKKLLPEPVLVPNPLWPGHEDMKTWSRQVVIEVMQTEEYEILLHKYLIRSEACKAAAKRKAKTLEEMMIELAKRATVTIDSDYNLINDALFYKERDFIKKGKTLYYDRISKANLDRWVVNHIRHRLIKVDGVRYDKALDELAGKVGRDNAYRVTKCILLDKIALVYPKYRYECERQKWECEREARMAA